MIRYELGGQPLEKRVSATWMQRATKRTNAFVKQRVYKETSPIWSEVKSVFMELQHNKCVFCERQLEGPEYGSIEHDLEHFRPKSSVSVWPGSNHPRELAYSFQTGRPGKGYYWLAYDLSNYAAACKSCNSPLKSNHFPVEGNRGRCPADFARLRTEKPLLCLPIGAGDEDPETLVTFAATTAIPAARSGPRFRRGRVIIDFFDLNGRELLHRDRARMLVLLYNVLLNLKTAKGSVAVDLKNLADRFTSVDSPHTGCCRAFQRQWNEDQSVAVEIGNACTRYLASERGTQPPGK